MSETPEDLARLLAVERVAALLDLAAAERPDAPFAKLTDGTALTIGALDALVETVAERLREHGVGAGSRVAVGMSNSPGHIAVIHALYRLGAVWVPLNPRLRGIPLAHVLADCAPAWFLGDGDGFHREVARSLEEARPGEAMRELGPVADGVEAFSLGTQDDAVGTPAELRAIMYTSGTTGAPKGVMVTDAMLIAAAASCVRVTRCDSGDVLYVWEPLHHIGGAQLVLLPLFADVALALGPAFAASSFWADAAAAGATHIHYLGGILQRLLAEPPSPAERGHAVRIAWGAGATPEIWAECERRFGIRVHECYGATETSSIVSVNTVGADRGVGTPLPWFDVRVVPVAGAPGGELEVRPALPALVTPGYWRNPGATAAARDGDWWRTGDLAVIGAHGDLGFLGRVADGIRVRGENLSAWQIEAAFDTHPAVAKSAVVGVPSERGDQDLLLFVQPAEGAGLDLAELAGWAAQRLPSLYVPRYARVVEAFELTPSQRVAKARLDRDLAAAVELRAPRRGREGAIA